MKINTFLYFWNKVFFKKTFRRKLDISYQVRILECKITDQYWTKINGKHVMKSKFLKCPWIFGFFYWIFGEDRVYFYTGFLTYNVSIQPDIMQGYWKNIWENHKYVKNTHLNIFVFLIGLVFDPTTWGELEWVQPNYCLRACEQ